MTKTENYYQTMKLKLQLTYGPEGLEPWTNHGG